VSVILESGVKQPHSKATSPQNRSCLFVFIRG